MNNIKRLHGKLKEFEPSGFMQVGEIYSNVMSDGDEGFLIESSASKTPYTVVSIGDDAVAFIESSAQPVTVVEGEDHVSITERLIAQAISHGDGQVELIPSSAGVENYPKEFKNCVVFPKMVYSGRVVFGDHSGRSWITSTSNYPNVTLSLFNLLHDENNDHLALKLPGLMAADNTDYGSVMASKVMASALSRAELNQSVSELYTKLNPTVIAVAPKAINSSTVYGTVTGEVVDLAANKEALMSNYKVFAANKDVSEGKSSSFGEAIATASEVIFSSRKDDSVRLTCIEDTGARILSHQFVYKGELVTLSEILSSAGRRLVDVQTGGAEVSEQYLGSRVQMDQFRALMSSVESSFVPEDKPEVHKDVKVMSCVNVAYNTKKLDGSCKVTIGDASFEKPYEEVLASSGMPAYFKAFDEVNIIRK